MELLAKGQVLVPIDFSDESFEALTYAVGLVEDTANLHVLHILPRLEPTEPGVIWQSVDDQTRKQNVRNAFFEKFSNPKHQKIQLEVIIGDPVTEILNYAKTQSIDLIVISSHARISAWHYLTRPVAERVVRFAHSPVLVLHK